MRTLHPKRSHLGLLGLVLLLAAAPACRTAAPEAGLDRQLFVNPKASLAVDPHGYWFAVAAQKAPLAPYVTVTYDGQTELFYAFAKGKRAAQLLPLTPVDSTWFAAAIQAGATPHFVSKLAKVEPSDPVGIWNGDAHTPVTWLGPKPDGDLTAVAVPAVAPRTPTSFDKLAVAVVDLDSAHVRHVSNPMPSAKKTRHYLLLPEGPRRARKLDVVNFADEQLEAPAGSPITVETKKGPQFGKKTLSKYAVLPVGRKAGADILAFQVDHTLFIANIGPDHVRLGNQARVEAAIAELPLAIAGPKAFQRAVRGLVALREGRPLAADYWLGSNTVAVYGNAAAASMRMAELAAAAGRTQWSRVALLSGAKGISADRALYLARAELIEGDLDAARADALRAADGFRSWSAPTKHTGAARAHLIAARADHLRGKKAEAVDLAQKAVEDFGQANDALRRSDTEMAAADIFFEQGQPEKAIEYARLARSRYYHNGSHYFSALTEIRLAEYLLAAGKVDEAAKMAKYATLRMKKFGEPVGLVRASIVETLTNEKGGGADEFAGQLQNEFDTARELDDPTAMALAAALIVNRTSVDKPQRMVTLGAQLVAARDDVADPAVQQRRAQAIASLCGAGVTSLARKTSPGEALALGHACHAAVAKAASDPKTLRAWLRQGYKALQNGEVDLAKATASQLASNLGDNLKMTSPKIAADILFFQYAIASMPTVKPSSAVANSTGLDKAADLLHSGLDPAKAPALLQEMAHTYRARGLTSVAEKLGEQAMKDAHDAKQYARERDLLFFLLQTYHEDHRPHDVLRLAHDGRKIVSRAGPGSAPLEARVLLYQSDAEYRLGRTSDASLHRSNALATANKADGPVRLSLLLDSADLDLERHALESAQAALGSGMMIFDKTPSKQRTGRAQRANFAHLHTLSGEVAVQTGKLDAARQAFDQAIALSDNADEPDALTWRVRALAGRAGLSTTDSERSSAQAKLAKTLDKLEANAKPHETIAAHRAAVEYYLDSGDASSALRVARGVHDHGFSLAPRAQAVCLSGRVALFAGKNKQAMHDLAVCAAQNDKRPSGAFAHLLAAMHDEAHKVTDRGAIAAGIEHQLADALTADQKARLTFISELPKADKPFDERKASRLQHKAAKTDAPADVAAYASYLLATGHLDEANAYIDKTSTTFFKQGQESPGMLIRLRLESMVRQLRPVDAALYAERALSETRDVTDAERAHIDFLLAQNEVIAGRWWRAAQFARQANALASDRALSAELAAFAKKFPPIDLK